MMYQQIQGVIVRIYQIDLKWIKHGNDLRQHISKFNSYIKVVHQGKSTFRHYNLRPILIQLSFHLYRIRSKIGQITKTTQVTSAENVNLATFATFIMNIICIICITSVKNFPRIKLRFILTIGISIDNY